MKVMTVWGGDDRWNIQTSCGSNSTNWRHPPLLWLYPCSSCPLAWRRWLLTVPWSISRVLDSHDFSLIDPVAIRGCTDVVGRTLVESPSARSTTPAPSAPSVLVKVAISARSAFLGFAHQTVSHRRSRQPTAAHRQSQHPASLLPTRPRC